MLCSLAYFGNSWLTIAGLTADALGFIIIASAALRAIDREKSVRNKERARQFALRAADNPKLLASSTTNEGEGRRRISTVFGPPFVAAAAAKFWAFNVGKEIEQTLGQRFEEERSSLLFGAVLVVVGFALQIAGAWPC